MSIHPPHPFPARMAPSIAMAELSSMPSVPLRVLDPMCGSGTVLSMARLKGHISFGFDTDPLAGLLSAVWCSDIQQDQVRQAAQLVVSSARSSMPNLMLRDAYPFAADYETKSFIRYWFDAYNRRQLRCLSDAIRDISDNTIRNVLWVAFSRLIISKSRGASLANDLSHSRPHRVLGKILLRPISSFIESVEYILRNSLFLDSSSKPPSATIRKGDARSLPLEANSIDLVITSPPYLTGC